MCPVKTQISLYIYQFVNGSLDSPEAVKCICDQRRLWSDCADVQADLSLRWSHKSYCTVGFVMSWFIYFFCTEHFVDQAHIITTRVSLFWMAMSPGVSHIGYTYLNLLDLPELLQILVTLTAVIKSLLTNFLGRAIVIVNFARRFRNFLSQTQCLDRKI